MSDLEFNAMQVNGATEEKTIEVAKVNNDQHIKFVNRTNAKGLSALSYNMSCSSVSLSHDKITKLCDYIKKQGIGVICLQDVSETSLTIFKSKIFGYEVLETFIDDKKETGTVIFFLKKKFELVDPYYLDCPSTMDRSLIGCKIKSLSGTIYDIVNVHLEDFKYNDEYRAKQFSLVAEYTNENPNTLVLGDFNIFDVAESVNDMIETTGMTDAWIALGCPNKLRSTTTFKDINKSIRSVRALHYSTADFTINKMALINLVNTRSALSVFFNDK